MTALLRQSVYGRTAGYDDVNDADRLRVDPAMRTLVGGRAVTRHAASTSQMAEVAIPRRLFATILRRIARLRPVPV